MPTTTNLEAQVQTLQETVANLSAHVESLQRETNRNGASVARIVDSVHTCEQDIKTLDRAFRRSQ